MTTFGTYQAVHELHRMGHTSIWRAVQTGHANAPPAYVVKAVQAKSTEKIEEDAAVRELLDQAQVLKKIATSGGEHWIPIHESGMTKRGCFYATDYYNQSVETLILGKARLEINALHHLISSMTSGLLELEQACHRPHGNLKTTNIFLSKKPNSHQPHLHLSDPLASFVLDESAAHQDLRTIGEFIYKLVTHQTFRAMGGWPIPKSDEWGRLGGKKWGERWHDLCNRLLDPNLAKQGLTIQKLNEELAGLRRPPPPLWPKVLAACLVAGVLTGGGYYYWLRGQPSPDQVPFDRARWEELCDDTRNWYAQLIHDWEKSNKLSQWDQDQHLKTIIQHLQEVKNREIVYDPREIAGQPSGSIIQLKNDPPAAAKGEDLTGDGPGKTKDALEYINKVELQLPLWDPVAELQRHHELFQKWGWNGAANSLENLIAGVIPSVRNQKLNVADGVLQVRKHYAQLQEVFEYCTPFGTNLTAIESGIEEIEKELPDDPKIAAFEGRLSKHRDEFGVTVHLALQQTEVDTGQETITEVQGGLLALKTLKHEVGQFLDSKPDAGDPRPALRNELEIRLASMDDESKPYLEDSQIKDLQQQRETLKGRMTALLKHEWKQRHRRAIDAQIQKIRSRADELKLSLAQRVKDLKESPAEADPRESETLTKRFNRAQQDVRILSGYDAKKGTGQQTRLGRIHDDFEAIKSLEWNQYHKVKIDQEVASINAKLDAFDQSILSALDPRPYSRWEDRLNKIKDVFEQTPKARTQELGKTYDQLVQDIQDLKSIQWNSENRDLIEQKYSKLDENLSGLYEKLDVDPREVLKSDWPVLASHIQDILTLRKELGDPKDKTNQSSLEQLKVKYGRLIAPDWPKSQAQKDRIRQDVQELNLGVKTLIQNLDPRKIWNGGDLVAEIKQALEQIRINPEPDASKTEQVVSDKLTELDQSRDQLKGLSWETREQQNEVLNQLADVRRELRSLRGKIIRDPRKQIKWDTIFTQVDAEIDEITRQKHAKGPILKTQWRDSHAAYKTLIDLRWSKKSEQEISAGVKTILSDLRDQYVQAVQSQPGIEGVSSPVLQAFWRTHRKDLVEPKHIPDLMTLVDKVNLFRDFIRDKNEAFPIGMPANALIPGQWQEDAAKVLINQKRDKELQKALESFDWDASWSPDLSKEWKSSLGAYVRWRKDLVGLAGAFKKIEAALDNAYGLDDPIVKLDSGKISQLISDWRDRNPTLYEESRGILDPILQRLQDLEEIDSDTDRATLLKLATKGQTQRSPAVTYAAWRQLGLLENPQWPGGLDELQQEHKISQWLHAVSQGFDDASQKARLEKELDRQRYERWVRGYQQITQASNLVNAIQLFRQSGMQEGDSRVPPTARFDMAVLSFWEAVEQMGADTPQARVIEQVKTFVSFLNALPPDVASLPTIQTLRSQLERIAAEGETNRGGGNLSKAGLRVSRLWNDKNWETKETPDGSRVQYLWKSKQKIKHTIEFVRVEPSAQASKPYYLSTTEVSLGLFIDVVSQAGHGDYIESLLPDPAEWFGPRVWRWNNSNRLRQNRRWTASLPQLKSSDPDAEYDDYAQGLIPGKPSKAHPMQHVPPEAAVYMAGLLNCRLPTPGEWLSALDIELARRSPSQYMSKVRPNLRDQTWMTQYNHNKSILAQGDDVSMAIAPFSGSFALDTGPNHWQGYNDEHLWFAKADPGPNESTFKHLVGNVSEFVLDGYDMAVPLPEGQNPGDQVRSHLIKGKLSIAGSSALSSPQNPPFRRVQSVTDSTLSKGYSDVGFRLAFSAPSESTLAKLKRVFEKDFFIFSSGGSPRPGGS